MSMCSSACQGALWTMSQGVVQGFSYEAPSLLREDAGYSDYQVMKSRAVKANV